MQLNDEISDKTSCLMCFERLQQHCHRSIVANKLKEYNKNNSGNKYIFEKSKFPAHNIPQRRPFLRGKSIQIQEDFVVLSAFYPPKCPNPK